VKLAALYEIADCIIVPTMIAVLWLSCVLADPAVVTEHEAIEEDIFMPLCNYTHAVVFGIGHRDRCCFYEQQPFSMTVQSPAKFRCLWVTLCEWIEDLVTSNPENLHQRRRCTVHFNEVPALPNPSCQ
jgi:hypothetical protein